ncbi:MAG: ARMT1-like domain-containing protein [Gammaproteobacteria bacterium]|nr:ARMT1-like domain-containing protein [Gammaproteobacteria bacterium]MCW8841561.1 ARMT1-like domain-containing protein [Gammaproteobacteria bacterium]MCW8957890.1 ARMT1-like domain-containing protein [Gammaproteobacteria bacterium]MCW8973841.1 ARMT1-like domain-containing protein [Gammaproteobacteria bacterium]MCW8992757.1 ARMT1-like domain-containing protein [Gammaproteobacteria bacterium]
MKAKAECLRCFQRQAQDAAGLAGMDEAASKRLLERIRGELVQSPLETNPAITASHIHALIRQQSHNPDPFREKKREATAHALSLYPRLKQLLQQADDPFDTAVRLALAGNIIDLGVAADYDLEASIERVLALTPAINHLPALRIAMKQADNILYLADNAGETVMDRLLIETIGKPVTYVVKGGAAVNDATREDALAAGIDRVAEVVDNGAAAMGTILDQCSAEFRQRFDAAELVIAKGMANYESLSGTRENLFFLLQAKCAVVAADLGVAEKSIVILENR